VATTQVSQADMASFVSSSFQRPSKLHRGIFSYQTCSSSIIVLLTPMVERSRVESDAALLKA
jgi:hypothetical protein